MIEESIASAVAAACAPLAAEIRDLRAVVTSLKALLPPNLVSVSEACRLTGLSKATIHRRVKSGELGSVRIGQSLRIDLSLLQVPSPECVTRAARGLR